MGVNNGTLFIGSEDPDVIREAIQWGKHTGWRVVYTTLFDRNAVSAGRNFSVQGMIIYPINKQLAMLSTNHITDLINKTVTHPSIDQ